MSYGHGADSLARMISILVFPHRPLTPVSPVEKLIILLTGLRLMM